jgi:hypothetical protein
MRGDKEMEKNESQAVDGTAGGVRVDRIVRLYAWQPNGHGEESFFVMAESEESAKVAVETEMARLLALSADDDYLGDEGFYSGSSFSGWGTDYYTLTEADLGKVLRNSND